MDAEIVVRLDALLEYAAWFASIVHLVFVLSSMGLGFWLVSSLLAGRRLIAAHRKHPHA